MSTPQGWCPFATVNPSPNFQKGRTAKLAAVVLHVADDTAQSAISWLCNPVAGASAHAVISKAGAITQLVSIFDTAWGNGLDWNGAQWVDPEGNIVHPAWPGLIVGKNPNAQTISIEHEGKPDDVWTPEMDAANTRFMRWITDQTGLTYTPKTTLIGHSDISPISRAYCPGPAVDYWRIAAAANLPHPGTRTVSVPVANVRSGPARSWPVLSQRTLGAVILGDTWVLGESIAGEARWLHRPGGQGFMHASVLAAVGP